ncbi:MAG TPA: hypothetical protein VGN17_24345 [Bryobacteraceae bacterium]
MIEGVGIIDWGRGELRTTNLDTAQYTRGQKAMPWKWFSADQMDVIVVDPDFRLDLLELAREHAIWIVDSPQNEPRIDAAWKVGGEAGLYSISRNKSEIIEDRMCTLQAIAESVYDHRHHESKGVIVYGLEANDDVVRRMKEWGMQVTERRQNGFVALGKFNFMDWYGAEDPAGEHSHSDS